MPTAELLNQRAREYDTEYRRYYDTVTWLAEVLPGSMRTPFEYSFDGRELYAEDGGALRPIFTEAIDQARALPDYEQRRRQTELEEYEDMLSMARCELPNTMVVVSDFPPELMNATKDIGGYNVSRKQTMLRVIVRLPDGKLKMYSQSLDGSDRQGLEAMYSSLGFQADPGELLGQRMHLDINEYEQEFLIDQLMGIYDRTLGSDYHAGIKGFNGHNTYDFVRQQHDLISAYLASTNGFTGGFRDYSLAAAVKERFLNPQSLQSDFIARNGLPVAAYGMAIAEMNGAGNRAQARGETFSGCGSSVGSGKSTSAESQLDSAGYGNESDKAESGSVKLVWKDGVCRIDKCPTRPGKTKVAQCSVCKLCQGWFDKGKDPNRMYKTSDNTVVRSIIETSFSSQQAPDKEKTGENAWLN